MEPRYEMRSQYPVVFLGQAGPVDLWRDKDDHALPYLMAWANALHETKYRWRRDVPSIMRSLQSYGLHLTLHDQCRLYQLTENNGVSERPNREGAGNGTAI